MIKTIIRGCGYTPECGSHPGTPVLILLVIAGAIAGSPRGLLWALAGAGIMLTIVGPMYLAGAYSRGKIRS